MRNDYFNEKNRFFNFFYSPIFFGIIAGILAVLAQPIFKIQPPQAYGICTVCHGRDLINWLSKFLFSIELESAEVSKNIPLLTTIGITIGSIVSSLLNKEFKFIKSENLVKMFLLGIVVSNFGLVIISCTTRVILRFAFGDPYAFLAIIGLMIGITFGVVILRRL